MHIRINDAQETTNAALLKRVNEAERELIAWRSAFQSVTPGGSEFCDPKAVRAWADMLKTNLFNATKRAVTAEMQLAECRAIIKQFDTTTTEA